MSNTSAKKAGGQETPLMKQYYAIKAQHQDAILFFRMGDFYEMFGEDARVGARVLGITLTSRGHGKAGDIPLAGFPYHAVEPYLRKMIQAGHRVAICEQVEDPKLARGIVKREVIQIVTPGTVTEDNLLESRKNNFLSALYLSDTQCGLASADVSTGEFLVTEISQAYVLEAIESVGPAELLVPAGQKETFESFFQSEYKPLITTMEDWLFGRGYAYEQLTTHFQTTSLKGFGCEDLNGGLSAAGAVLTYLQDTQRGDLSHLQRLRRYSHDGYMILDSATRRNLELTTSMMEGRSENTLLSILDHTKTAMGGRTLSAWLNRPLVRLEPIRERLDGVETLLENRDARDQLCDVLKGMADLERLVSKVVMKRVNPRDLQALRKSLAIIPDIQRILTPLSAMMLQQLCKALAPCEAVVHKIEAALVDDPPAVFQGAQIFKEGYHGELDELREIAHSGKGWIAKLQATEREETGIPSLKVGFNKVFGYYLEVTKTHLDKVPAHYIRKQTLVNAERFITPGLKEMEEKVLKAEERISSLQNELFDALRSFVSEFASSIQQNGQALGELDALLSLASAAQEFGYAKPVINESDIIELKECRHPVVERLLATGDPFIPNDLLLDQQFNQVLIITGPNMAGKSTYIRQIGLIVLMAQIGSFVPAKAAKIGIVDRIFTRVGAQDNLAGGESTFLVEMNETANILNNATPKSLVLLDEVGRGTSTFDGLSIAWSIAEFLHNSDKVRPKTLFATHYHELTELALILPRVKNYNVAVKEWGDHIVFLRKIVPGGCDHSYGIQVARLAGLPNRVIKRAKQILNNLEANELTPNEIPKLAVGEDTPAYQATDQLNMFAEQETKLRDALKDLDVNQMTPLEAMQMLDELRKMVT